MEKIKELIESSKFGIHDLSRSIAKVVGEYYRMNMPFELGLDLGCRSYHPDGKYKTKKILILEEVRYSTQKALSDLSFADCKCHKNEAEELVYEVRNWFSECSIDNVPSASSLWDDYNYFYLSYYKNSLKKGFNPKDIDRLPVGAFIQSIKEWCA